MLLQEGPCVRVMTEHEGPVRVRGGGGMPHLWVEQFILLAGPALI